MYKKHKIIPKKYQLTDKEIQEQLKELGNEIPFSPKQTEKKY